MVNLRESPDWDIMQIYTTRENNSCVEGNATRMKITMSYTASYCTKTREITRPMLKSILQHHQKKGHKIKMRLTRGESCGMYDMEPPRQLGYLHFRIWRKSEEERSGI